SDWAPRVDGEPKSMVVVGNAVYVGGDIALAAGAGQQNLVQRDHLAAFGADGALLPWNPRADGQVLALAAVGDTIYAAGDFAFVGGIARKRLAAIGVADGAVRSGWSPDADDRVRALAIDRGTVYIGGDLTHVSGV